jgi:hypothetical protein
VPLLDKVIFIQDQATSSRHYSCIEGYYSSPHCCSFTAVIRDGCAERGVSFGQAVPTHCKYRLYGEEIDDFTKPVPHPHFRLVAQLCRLPQRQQYLQTCDADLTAKYLVPGRPFHLHNMARRTDSSACRRYMSAQGGCI